MNLVFIHGWSVTSTDAYGELPAILAQRASEQGMDLKLVDIQLGRYISFHDEVRMDDVVRALQQALLETLPDGRGGISPFACITHSAGGPVARSWVMRFYAQCMGDCPMRQLIMLAPPNHGSALAIFGSERLGRIRAATNGIEPGEGMLKWLELGSDEARELNLAWLTCDPFAQGSRFRPFVLIGETIDPRFYDFVNSYLGEAGSDGVVRVAAAAIDYRWFRFEESGAGEQVEIYSDEDACMVDAHLLTVAHVSGSGAGGDCPFLIVPDASHSGDRIGIMKSVSVANAGSKPVVDAIVDALLIEDMDRAAYRELHQRWHALNTALQGRGRGRRFFQLIVNVMDDEGFAVTDYDFLFLAGENYHPGSLPQGFLLDKQRNKRTLQRMTFFLDYDLILGVEAGRFGFRVVGRPARGFGRYCPVEYRSDICSIVDDLGLVGPNQTHYVDVVLKRHVDRQLFRLAPATDGVRSFKHTNE